MSKVGRKARGAISQGLVASEPATVEHFSIARSVIEGTEISTNDLYSCNVGLSNTCLPTLFDSGELVRRAPVEVSVWPV